MQQPVASPRGVHGEKPRCLRSVRRVGEGADRAQAGPGCDRESGIVRETIAAGAALNNRENLRQWVKDPDTFKPGALMPAMQLDEQDLDAVTDYLLSLR